MTYHPPHAALGLPELRSRLQKMTYQELQSSDGPPC